MLCKLVKRLFGRRYWAYRVPDHYGDTIMVEYMDWCDSQPDLFGYYATLHEAKLAVAADREYQNQPNDPGPKLICRL